MLSKIIFKRLLPATAIYYVSLQVYLIDHIFRSGQTKIIPEAVAISNETLAEREKILRDFFDILQINISPEKFDCFTKNATVEDPSIRFEGKAAIKNGLYFMGSVIQKSETLKMEVTHTKSKIFVDSEQRYTYPLGMKATLPQLVTLELVKDDEGNEKIARATEEWNSKPLLNHENTPTLFVGMALSYIRGMTGKMLEFVPATPSSS